MLFDVKPRVRITHPLADSVSIQNHKMAMGGDNTSELAFFDNGEWVTQIIAEFAEYACDEETDTLVYGWVPNEKVDAFLKTYRA